MQKRPAKKKAHTPKGKKAPSKRKYGRGNAPDTKAAGTAKYESKPISGTEFVIKMSIFRALAEEWLTRDEPKFVQRVQDNLFEKLFAADMRGVVQTHLDSLK